MARPITTTALKLIVPTKLSDTALTAIIATANRLVDSCITPKGVAAATLEDIETYLAAHIVTVTEPKGKSVRSSGFTVSYEGAFGEKFKSSRFGQLALALDPTGCLEALTKEDRSAFKFDAARASGGSTFSERSI